MSKDSGQVGPNRMKVVFATPYLPVPPDFGGARRMFELIRAVRRKHLVHTVSLVGPKDDVAGAEAEIGSVVPVRVAFTPRTVSTQQRRGLQLRSIGSPRSAQHRLYNHPSFQTALDRHIRTFGADLVQLEFSQMGRYHVPSGVASVLDVHNIESDLLRQMATSGSFARRLFNVLELHKFQQEEIAAWIAATCCVATSEADASVIERHTNREVQVIPNGVDLDYFQPSPDSMATTGAIVFVGAMRYRPNADAAQWFAELILPLVRQQIPNATFTIVGADPFPETLALANDPAITVTGTVADVRPWLQVAQIVVVPLRSGGGTRLKILEAFGAGRPVVSTTIGAQGIAAEDGKHLLLADDPAAFATQIVRLVRDDALRSELVASALALVRERYQWSTIAHALNDLYAELMADCRASR